MLDLDDDRWRNLEGGYKILFDPRPLLLKLYTDRDVEDVWHDLWNELHHQGDVGLASYAAVPHIVEIHRKRGVADWNTYAMVAVIELARDQTKNPPVPEWLERDYFEAIQVLAQLGFSEFSGAEDPETVRSMLSIFAIAKGLREHARLLINYSEQEIFELKENCGNAG